MPPGTSIVMSVGFTQVGTMERIDRTDPDRKLRFVRTINGRRVKSRVWFDKNGARKTPKETRDLLSYDIRSWTLPGRFTGTRVWRSGRK